MALWKPFRGTSAALADVPKTDGHAYFCTDDGSLFFDYKDENNELHRKQITAKELTPVNLLAETIVIDNLENPADANYIFLDHSLGFTLGRTYTLNYTYKGITKDITLLGCSQPQAGMGDEDSGVVIPQERMGQDFSFYTDDNGSSSDASGSLAVMIFDKCQATDTGVAYAENSAIIMVLANAENYALPFIINSITETQVEYATKSSVDELEERITVLEKSNEPVNLLSEPITIETVVDEEIHEIQSIGLVAGKSYTMSGTYGASNTAFEFTDTANSDEGAVMFANNSGAINGILMIGIMETPEGSFMMLGAQNPDDIDKVGEFSPVIISSILEVQPEYATQESVDNLSAEITSIDERVSALEAEGEPINLLSEPVTFETAGHEKMYQGNSMLGLVADKTYKVSALVGASATPFEYEVVAVKTDEAGGSITQIATPDDALFNSHLAIWVMDATGEVNGEPVNTNIIMISGSGEGANPEYGSGYNDEFFANDTYSPVIINSITEIQPEYATKKVVEELSASVNDLESRVSELENPSDNLFKTIYKFAEPWNIENSGMLLVDRLGLIPGKTYRVAGYYGGESLDSDTGATRFEWTAVAFDGVEVSEMMNIEGEADVSGLDFSENISENGTLAVAVYDGFYVDTSNGALVVDSSKAMLAFGYSGGDSDRLHAKNFVVESLTEVQVDYSTKEEFDELKARVEVLERADEAVNLLSEPITIEAWTSQEMPYEGASLGVVVDKTYTISGTMGSDNSPWSFTTTAMSSESFGLEPGAALLAQEDPINHVAVAIYDRFSLATGAPVIDNSKSYIVSGCTDASDANQPFIIDSVIEAQVEYSTKEEVSELAERVHTVESQLSGNILSEAIVIEEGNTEMEGAPAYMGAIDSIGLEESKKYQITYEYNGSTLTEDVIATTEFASSFFGIDGIITLAPIDENVENRQFAFIINNDTPVILADKLYADTMAYDASKFSIMAMTMGGTLQVPFSITSIIKATEVYATKEELETLEENIAQSADMMDAKTGTIEAQLGGNLLGKAISVNCQPINDGFVGQVEFDKLGIIEGKSYNIAYVYDGIPHIATRVGLNTITSGDNIDVEGAISLGSGNVNEAILLGDNMEGVLLIADGASLDLSSGSMEWLASTKATICYTYIGEEPKNLIITRIFETDKGCATKEDLEALSTQINSALSDKQPVGDYALNSAIPTKVSELENDSGFIASIPQATADTLGGVKNGGDVTINAGVITVNDDSHNHTLTTVTGLQEALDGKQAKGSYAAADHNHDDKYSEISHKHTKSEITDFPTLAAVATSGSYNDLSDKPIIPTTTSQLTNNSDFATNASVDTKVANLVASAPETLDTLGELATAIKDHEDAYGALLTTVGNKANKSDLATVATSGSYNDLSDKPTVDSALSSTSTNPVQNKAVNTALAGKVDKVSGKGLSTNDLTATLKSNYDTAYTHSQATHARTDATKVEASSTNGNIKINGTETTVYTHPTGTNPHGTTKSDVGLGNVGNFKAVSTVASQGLTETEKANARANIGAGTSNFTGYTSSNKLAADNVSGLATVATSGSYTDLSNKPAINGVEIASTSTSADLKLGEVTANGGFRGGTNAGTISGGAIGKGASTTSGGAVGMQASADLGGAIGWSAQASNGGAAGSGARAYDGFAGGVQALARYATDGITVLSGAVAIGANAVAKADHAVQLGTGTNTNEGTLQFRNYQLLNASGVIPASRLPGIYATTSSYPNDSGDIKTKCRIAKRDYTGGATTTWYYKLCTLPANNSGNYASALVSGRIGGWESANMSYINALLWNRGTPGIALIDISADGSSSTVWNTAQLVTYVDGTSNTANATATVYIACKGYFTFDIDLKLYQSDCEIIYDGTYTTTAPTGTLAAQCINTNKRLELANGKLQLNGKAVLTEANYNPSTKILTIS